MAVNSLTVNQAATILNTIMEQANIGGELATVDGGNFVSVGQNVLQAGYDVVLNAISQILTRTIFSVRPYEQKFGNLEADAQRFGNVTRKLNIADNDFENGEFDLPVDGQAVDHYKIKRANVLQMNFYGQNNYELQQPTIFRNQLDVAFSSPEELVQFWGMITQNAYDTLTQAKENLARATVANYIGGKIAAANAGVETGNVIHLISEYNEIGGTTYTAEEIKKPENYPAFMQWVYGRIQGLCSMMTERSQIFHTNVTGKEISRHTPLEMQRVYLFNPEMYMMDARVLADKYHVNFLTYSDYQPVNFWQNIEAPGSIKVTPTYLKKDGTLAETQTASAIEQDNIFGVVFDRDTLGYSPVDEWVGVTPLNAKGGYTNVFIHTTVKYWTDYTENGFVLLMD